MSRIIALIISFLLVGCATPPNASSAYCGEVRMSRPLSRIAHIDVSMFGLYEGKVREVQRTHFETGNLPLFFSIKLNPAQRGKVNFTYGQPSLSRARSSGGGSAKAYW